MINVIVFIWRLSICSAQFDFPETFDLEPHPYEDENPFYELSQNFDPTKLERIIDQLNT